MPNAGQPSPLPRYKKINIEQRVLPSPPGFKRTYAENRPRPGTVLYSLRINLKRFNNVIKSLFNIDDKNKISCKNINSGLFKPLFMAYTLQTKLK
jgi:hypothetical protein